jgi:hypothetical protein
MNKEIKIQHLILLVAVLFFLYYIITNTTILKKESFDNTPAIDKKNKTCSQDSINTGVKDYIFSGKPFVR